MTALLLIFGFLAQATEPNLPVCGKIVERSFSEAVIETTFPNYSTLRLKRNWAVWQSDYTTSFIVKRPDPRSGTDVMRKVYFDLTVKYNGDQLSEAVLERMYCDLASHGTTESLGCTILSKCRLDLSSQSL